MSSNEACVEVSVEFDGNLLSIEERIVDTFLYTNEEIVFKIPGK